MLHWPTRLGNTDEKDSSLSHNAGLLIQLLRNPLSDECTTHLSLLQDLRLSWVQLCGVMRNDINYQRLQSRQTTLST